MGKKNSQKIAQQNASKTLDVAVDAKKTAQTEKTESGASVGVFAKIRAVDWDDLLARAAWTFLQAFFAVILLDAEGVINLIFSGDWAGAWTLSVAILVAGLSAGLSALKSFAVGILKGGKKC